MGRSERMIQLAVALLLACGEAPPPELLLDGPARVRVDQLGPVSGPRVVLPDGTPAAVDWTVSDEGVATVVAGEVVAEGPGEVQVTGEHKGQHVTWTLVVDPALVVRIQGAPGSASVGDMLQLTAIASIGDEEVDSGTIAWSSSDPDLLEVATDGSATALGSGRVWVTARSRGGAQSMVEIDIR